jgi:hypothetical protein
MKLMSISLAVLISCLIGWIVYVATDSTTASYIVGVISMALGVVATVVALYTPAGQGIRSKIRGRKIEDSTMTGVRSSDHVSGSINSDIKARGMKNSKVTGVDIRVRPPTQPGTG